MSRPKYPDVHVRLTGQDGNAYVVLGIVNAALKRAGVPKADRDVFMAEATSGTYDHVLQTAMRWVEVS